MFNVKKCKNEIVVEIISIEKKTFEELVSRLGQFVKRMDSINRQRNGRRMSEWMDNHDVCQALKISPRLLQMTKMGTTCSNKKEGENEKFLPSFFII